MPTIAGYTYQADQLCPECTRKRLGFGPGTANPHDDLTVEERLTSIANRLGIDRDDERSFDSDDFPKVIFSHQLRCESFLEHERCGDCGVTLCGAPEPADRASERVGADLDD